MMACSHPKTSMIDHERATMAVRMEDLCRLVYRTTIRRSSGVKRKFSRDNVSQHGCLLYLHDQHTFPGKYLPPPMHLGPCPGPQPLGIHSPIGYSQDARVVYPVNGKGQLFVWQGVCHITCLPRLVIDWARLKYPIEESLYVSCADHENGRACGET